MSASDNDSLQTTRSPQQRKEFLRDVLSRAQCLQENVSSHTINSLDSIMADTDSVSSEAGVVEKVNHQDEVVLDSEMMSISSDILKRCTDTLNKDTNPYTFTEFADRIISYVQQIPDTVLEEPNWAILGDEISKLFRITPATSALLGTLKPLEKPVVVRKKQGTRDVQAAIKRPENVVAVEKVEEGVEETVHKIKVLISQYCRKHQKCLDFFQLILDPEDFGQTIENMLHVSFLVRDGVVKVLNDEDGRLVVCPSGKEALARAKKSGKAANLQNVMSMSVENWRTLKQTYRLTKPMIDFHPEKRA